MKSLSALLGELLVVVFFGNLILVGMYTAALLLSAIVEVVR